MPIHDWSRVGAGLFHHFHQAWTVEISNALNGGTLPADYFAMAEHIVGGPIPDVVTLQRRARPSDKHETRGGVAVAMTPPQAKFIRKADPDGYVRKANRLLIKHRLGRVVAVVEVVSPGNKSSSLAMQAFVAKAHELLSNGVNLLVVDLFPPSPRDPRGIHEAIWDAISFDTIDPPAGKMLTVAAYDAESPMTAYVEPVGIGDPLPNLPIFLEPGLYVPAPLEATYQTTWEKCPAVLREEVVGLES